MPRVKFTIPGEPQGKGRPRFARAGNYVRTFTPDKTVAYENLVKLEYERQCKGFRFEDGSPLDVRIVAYYGIPKSASKKKRQDMIDYRIRPIKKVDVDNLVKVVLDSLNDISYKDDIQVVDCQVRKFYAEVPKVVVTISDAKPMTRELAELLEKKRKEEEEDEFLQRWWKENEEREQNEQRT